MRRIASVVSMIALVVSAGSASALDLQMTGTFNMSFLAGTPGADLAAIVGNQNNWTISLYGVQFVCNPKMCNFPPSTGRIRYLLATSFSFQFSGPDAIVLNDVVGQHFTQGGLYPYSAFFQVESADCSPYEQFTFYIWPTDTSTGVYMEVDGFGPPGTFPTDMSGCPIIGPFEQSANQVVLFDRRPGNDGNIAGFEGCTIALQLPVSVSNRSWGAVKTMYR
jgi:hypothetical protein